MYIGLHVNAFILVIFSWNLNFLDSFSKNIQMSNFMKIRQVGARIVPCRQTDRHDEANSHKHKTLYWGTTFCAVIDVCVCIYVCAVCSVCDP